MFAAVASGASAFHSLTGLEMKEQLIYVLYVCGVVVVGTSHQHFTLRCASDQHELYVSVRRLTSIA